MQHRQIVSTLVASVIGTPLFLLPGAAWAAYPDKPVIFVVPSPPGGPADGYRRAFAQALSVQLKQTVEVQNRAGVGGALGVPSVARAAPDAGPQIGRCPSRRRLTETSRKSGSADPGSCAAATHQ